MLNWLLLIVCSITMTNAWEIVSGSAPAAIKSPVATAVQSKVTSRPAIELVLPLECQLDETCWVVNNVDLDTSSGAKDYKCGYKTYEGHKGVDFALRDMAAMRAGVKVVAAAAGTVKAVREGMGDVTVKQSGIASKIKGQECGNGVVLAHKDGWETQYCHLKQGSINVKVGQSVTAGTVLGQVGLSGNTEYPHLHLSVRHNGKPVDPSYGEQDDCGKIPRPMWAGKLKFYPFYRTGNIYNFGFSTEKPMANKMRDGQYLNVSFTNTAPMLVGWADIFNVEPGDKITVQILKPDNSVFTSHTTNIKKYQARYFVFSGARRPANQWPTGAYKLKISYHSNKSGNTTTKQMGIANSR